MGSLPLDSESPISVQNKEMDFPEMGFEESIQTRPKKDVWSKKKKKKGKCQVFLEGYVETDDREKVVEQKGVARTKSLTDDDLDELKGCLDLGFGFNYEEIPELCNTLPALELCYSMSQRFLDEQHRVSDASNEGATATETCSSGLTSSPIANWKISSPGDHPEEVKARLKFWAQAVACTVRVELSTDASLAHCSWDHIIRDGRLLIQNDDEDRHEAEIEKEEKQEKVNNVWD